MASFAREVIWRYRPVALWFTFLGTINIMTLYADILPAGTTVSWLHSVYKILLTPHETNGLLGMFSAVGAPDSGPPRHVHENEDETIHIVEGEAEFWLEGETFRRGAGDTVFVPRGKEHAFHIVSSTPARFITCLTPGGFESFFAAAARDGLQIPQHGKELNALAGQYGCRFTGPPLRQR
ncbi:cupin domain-containing protein [Hyphomicrobiales bacterium]|jgi:quercetin dioxygenase-like cupin family protein